MQPDKFEANNKMAIKTTFLFFYPYLHNSGIYCLKKIINILKAKYSTKRLSWQIFQI